MAETMDNRIAELRGMVHAALLACTSIVALHPERTKILVDLEAGLVSDRATELQTDSDELKSYKRGIRTVLSTIHQGATTVQHLVEKGGSTHH